MLFRAVIRESHIMKEFLNTIVTLSKLTKTCVMIISPNKVDFIVNEELTSIAPLVWTEIQTQSYFDEYKMEGLDSRNNKIYLLFNPSNLARALQGLRSTVIFCKLKLSNKQFPCVTVELELPASNSVQSRTIIHDVPVQIIPKGDWTSYEIPIPEIPNICLTLPSIKFIRNLIDKLKNLSPTITFYGTSEGEISVVLETDSLTLCSRYKNLEIKSTNRDDAMDIDDDDTEESERNNRKKRLYDNNRRDKNKSIDDEYFESSCTVDCKKSALFLTALQISQAELNFSIIRSRLVQMEIEIGWGLKMHCIIPAVCV